LHWAKTREVVDALADAGCQVNARNFQGFTALHLMVENERLECALALVTHGADIDVAVEETNETALHMAVKAANLPLVRGLLAFEADTSVI